MGTLWDSVMSGYEGGDDWYEPDTPAENVVDEGSLWDSFIGSASTTRPGGSGAVDYHYVVKGLMQRGLPQHIAEGFAMNFQDESGFVSDIQERTPMVAGSRGGRGLYQLTGSRRRDYEAKYGEGYDADDQMDFLMWELDNTERSARDRIMSTTSAGDAGVAIVESFLRPAAEHRKTRALKYSGGSATQGYTAPQPTKLWLDF